jgi:DNA-binding XRE family transcriptional regulator
MEKEAVSCSSEIISDAVPLASQVMPNSYRRLPWRKVRSHDFGAHPQRMRPFFFYIIILYRLYCNYIDAKAIQLDRGNYMIDVSTLGERIAIFRRAAGFTQKDLAFRVGVSPQAVSKWERGLSCPDITILDELADAAGVSVTTLLGIGKAK